MNYHLSYIFHSDSYKHFYGANKLAFKSAWVLTFNVGFFNLKKYFSSCNYKAEKI